MRILIADDHDLLRDTLVLFLEGQCQMNTATASDFQQACTLIEDAKTPFDLVILDLNMPGMNGLVGLKHAMTLKGGQRVALMSGEATREVAERALEAGAAGFLPKTLPAKSMINAVRFMAMGEQYAPLEFMKALSVAPKNPLVDNLSPRELQMLKGLSQGKPNKEIARDLELTEATVKLHMKTLYRKLGTSNRTQAALIAREAGLF